jgi:RNA polymerase sigma factor (sigma-70 family)
MTSGPLHRTLGPLRQLAGAQFFAGWDDFQLLERFLNHADQAAFAEVVHRHRRLIWGLCRRLLRQEQDAEDVFQATFLVLALKARSIRKRQGLGSWLHGVAYRCAMQTRRHEARRKRHEQEAVRAVWTDAAEDIHLRELWELLADEVERLPEKHRAPFVLCCLEGKSQEEAGRDLGWTVGTVSGRLARARQELQKRLAKKGIPMSAMLGVTVLADAEVSAAVLAAAIRAAAAALSGTAAVASSISPKVLALVKGVSHAMFMSKIKSVAITLVLIALAAGGGVVAQQAVQDDRPAAGAPPGVAARPEQAPVGKNDPRKEKLRYDGKTFEYWRDFLSDELKPERRVEAMRAMGAFGASAYPKEASTVILKLMREYRGQDIYMGLVHTDWSPDQKVIHEAAMALAKIGPAAAPVMLEDLSSEDIRAFVAGVFQSHVPVPESSVPRLTKLIRTGSKGVRETAAVILYNGHGWSPEWRWQTVLPEAKEDEIKGLVRALSALVKQDARGGGQATEARTAAAGLLGLLGSRAREAAPGLVKALLTIRQQGRPDDFTQDTQYALKIIGALEEIRPGKEQIVAALASILADKDINWNVQHASFQLLRKIETNFEDLVPALTTYMELLLLTRQNAALPNLPQFTPKGEVEGIAALLETAGPKAKAAMPILLKTYKQMNTTRLAIIKTWTHMGPAAHEALPTLYALTSELGGGAPRNEEARRLVDAANEAIKAISK